MNNILVKNSEENVTSQPWRHTLLIERGKMPKLRKIKDRFLKQKINYSKEMRINNECKNPILQTACVKNQVTLLKYLFRLNFNS